EAVGSRNVQQYSPNDGRNQQWFLLPAPQPGEFFIISAKPGGLALDVEGESKNDGGNVQVYPFNGNENQRWRINHPLLIDSTNWSTCKFKKRFQDILIQKYNL